MVKIPITAMRIRTLLALSFGSLFFMAVLIAVSAIQISGQIDDHRSSLSSLSEIRNGLVAVRGLARTRLFEGYQALLGTPQISPESEIEVPLRFKELQEKIQIITCTPELGCKRTEGLNQLIEVRRRYEQFENALAQITKTRVPPFSHKAAELRAKALRLHDIFRSNIDHLISQEDQRIHLASQLLDEHVKELRRTMIYWATLAAALMVALTFWLTVYLVRHLRRLESATLKIGHGDFSVNLPPQGPHEVALVSEAMNTMGSRLLDAQEHLEQQHEALIHSEKMSALGLMAGGIAHEINNPLAVIELLAENLQAKEEFTTEQVKKNLAKIQSSVEQINKIIINLRAVSRNSGQDPLQAVPLKKLVDDTMIFSAFRFKRGKIDLRIDPIPEHARIRCRPSEISQVLVNLLNNASDAVENLEERWIQIGATETETSIKLAITNSGPPIPIEVRAKLFQPFFTTKPVGKGTGMGLSISREIIERLGGKLYFDPESLNPRFVIEFSKTPEPRI